jgi:phospholipid/cholesterol/gamma-HCH transport system substrate-binding protein
MARGGARELGIGISVTVATLIVIIGILYMERPSFLQPGLRLHLVTDNAQGIARGADVLYRGLSSGSVEDIRLGAEGVIIDLKLSRVTNIPKDSTFTMGSTNVLGGQVIQIRPGTSDEYFEQDARVRIEGGGAQGIQSLLPGDTAVEENLQQIVENIRDVSGEELQENLLSTLENMRMVTGEDFQNDLFSTMENLRNATAQIDSALRANRAELETTLKNLREITQENKEPIESTITRLEQDSKQLSETLQEVQSVSAGLDELITKLNRGEGTLGRLLEDVTLYNRLDRTITSLNDLITDISENPKKYFSITVF